MIKVMQLEVEPEFSKNSDFLKKIVSKKLQLKLSDIKYIDVLKRSVDARQKKVKINLKLRIFIQQDFIKEEEEFPIYKNVENKEEVIIIGAGPAGLFAALKFLERGIKPIIIERGKDVRSRRKDLANITKNHIVNEDSNYCFGEGGAGTYSDGKLYTRSKKRGDVNKILDILIMHGATPEIRIEAHPHIGTNKLPKIIQKIRQTIIEYGGKVLFNSRVIDIIIKNNQGTKLTFVPFLG